MWFWVLHKWRQLGDNNKSPKKSENYWEEQAPLAIVEEAEMLLSIITDFMMPRSYELALGTMVEVLVKLVVTSVS